jgi:hypothetical protein
VDTSTKAFLAAMTVSERKSKEIEQATIDQAQAQL